MDFNVMDYLAYHADVAVPAIILMVIVSAIYLIFYGIRPIKTRFLILFLLSIVSLIIFVLITPSIIIWEVHSQAYYLFFTT